MTVVDFLTYYISPFQAAVATSLLLFYFVYLFLKDNDLPPGPIGLPIIGYWPFLNGDTCHIQLKEMMGKYGDIFSFRVNGRLFVHLGSIKSIKEAHLTNSDSFGGRLLDYGLMTDTFGNGVGLINGEPWKILRRFFLLKYKEYGMNAVKGSGTGSMHDVINEFTEELYKSKGRPVAIMDLAISKASTVLRRMLFKNQGITIEEMQELIELYGSLLGGLNATNFMLSGNFAKYFIFPLMPCHWRMKNTNKRIEHILFSVIDRHEKDYDETQISGIVDSFIKERKDRERKGDSTASYFTERTLVPTLNQFLTDGVLTVGHFIASFIMSLAEHPEEQDKIYKELLEVIGDERLPTLEDKPGLPYTNAFMYEVMRLSDLFPLYPSLQCTKETTIQGNKIPEGAMTLINVYAAQRNPTDFDDPDTFNSSRYLTSSNKSRAELPVMFGVGKRTCIGEGFTMIQAFLFLTSIVRNFHFSFPKDEKSASHLLWSQESVHICAVPRSQKEQL